MDVRLVQLLGSFIAARNEYALARLEFALRHPAASSPPVIDRLSDASERALREEWPQVESQLGAGLDYARRLPRSRGRGARDDDSDRRLQRSLRELDQYARAIAWVLTVNESDR